MKMTMKEWRGYLRHQRSALWSYLRFVWCNSWAMDLGRIRRPIPFMSRSQWTMYSRIGTSGYFTLEAQLGRMMARKALDRPFHTPPSGLTREERRAYMLSLAQDITEKSDG